MKKTEKKYWLNGYHVRGKNFRTIAMNIGNIGIMLYGNGLLVKISFYKLINN